MGVATVKTVTGEMMRLGRLREIGNRVCAQRLCYLALCLVTSTVPFLYYIIRGKGFYLIGFDFSGQIIPFYVDMIRTIREGGIDSFSFAMDLGTSTMQAYSYYGLFSPFFLLLLLFPATAFPYVAGYLFILKYLVSCVTSFLFLRRFTRTETAAMAGSLFYAFSGYGCATIQFYFFHDVIALFPLLLLAFEYLMQGTDRVKAGLLFSVAVFVNCITNYFFFVQEVLFLLLYYLFLHARRDARRCAKEAGAALLYGALGCGLAAFVFLPNILYILDNNRVKDASLQSIPALLPDAERILMLLKGFLLPGEALNDLSCVLSEEFMVGSIFLPGGGGALALAYVYQKRDRLSAFLAMLFVVSFSPLLSSAFLLFVSDYYRWWFMFGLMLAAAAARVLDDMTSYPVRVSAAASVCMTVLFCAYLHIADGGSRVFHEGRLLFFLTTAAIGAFALLFRRCTVTIVSTSVIAMTLIISAQETYLKAWQVRFPWPYQEGYFTALQLTAPDVAYRFRNHANLLMITSEEGVNGMSSYATNVAPSLSQFDALFEYYDPNGHFRLNKETIPGLSAMLGGRFFVTADYLEPEAGPGTGNGVVIDSFPIEGREVSVQEYPASPIAYTVSRCIGETELDKLQPQHRAIALMYAVLLKEEMVASLPETIRAVDAEVIETMIASDSAHMEGEELFFNACIERMARENTSAALTNFERGYEGFGGRMVLEEAALLYASVPADPGWKATIDGAEQEILDSGGMMALIVPAGTHEIRFTYTTPFFKEGCAISILSFACFLILLFRGKILGEVHRK